MTPPPGDIINIPLVPNDDNGDENRKRVDAGANAAVQAASIAFARKHSIEIKEEPGAIEPDARENPQRATAIREKNNPALLLAASEYRKERVTEEVLKPGGEIHRRTHEIVEGRREMSISLEALITLIKESTYGVATGFSLVAKLVNWAREKLPTRKR